MSEKNKDKNKIKGAKTAVAQPLNKQGRFRWSFEYQDGKIIDKYNSDGSKNVYAERDEAGKPKVHVSLQNVQAVALTNWEGKIMAVMDVPEDAIVFQRRRANIRINYYERFHDIVEVIPEAYEGGIYYPERKVPRRVPETTYDQVWLVGWRRREADGSVMVDFKAVYPDGKIDEYTKWGMKGWLYEPEWFSEEQV